LDRILITCESVCMCCKCWVCLNVCMSLFHACTFFRQWSLFVFSPPIVLIILPRQLQNARRQKQHWIFQRFVSNQLLQTSHLMMIKTMKSTLSFEDRANLTIHSTCKAFTFITWIGGDIAKREKNMLFKNIPQTSTECVCVWQRVRALLSNRWCNFFVFFTFAGWRLRVGRI
jgi:hypothetical protein